MLQRFRPYFRYLQPHRGLLNLAILCGIIAGIASGFGLPYMVNRVFPVIFAEGAERLAGWKLATVILWIPAVFGIRGVAGYLNTYFLQLVGTRSNRSALGAKVRLKATLHGQAITRDDPGQAEAERGVA